MESKHSPFEAKEISQAAKGLKEAKTDDHSSLKASLEYDSKLANSVAKLYEEKEGDLRAVFEELNENPSKALKHPPKDADDFGKKYAQGFYALAK